MEALRYWNEHKKSKGCPGWTMPRRGTPDHAEVVALMNSGAKGKSVSPVSKAVSPVSSPKSPVKEKGSSEDWIAFLDDRGATKGKAIMINKKNGDAYLADLSKGTKLDAIMWDKPVGKRKVPSRQDWTPRAEQVEHDRDFNMKNWVTFLHKSQPYIRSKDTDVIYELNPRKTTHREMVYLDKPVGEFLNDEVVMDN
jgi:hypothetical protein